MSLSNRIIRRFELYCPNCKKSLYHDFASFKTYLRSKGKCLRDSNPFISGNCRECKNPAIEVDKDLVNCLKERNAIKKANYCIPAVNTVCFLIGLIAFSMLLSNVESDKEDKEMDVRSARKQIGAGEFEEAKKTLKLILNKQPNYSTVHELLGYIYLQEDKLEQALSHYQKAQTYSVDTNRINSTIVLIKQRMKNE